jgi:2-methylcitrate dehydratase PrpD
MGGHPTVPVAPAVFALSEHLAKSGRDLIAAFSAGVDTECILGRYAGPAHYAKGWHATGTLGSFGAAAAAARLHGLSVADTAQAFGIAGTQAAGLKAQFGTMCKPLHAGHAAATGVLAAALAGRGFESRSDILENAQGFMATQADSASEERFGNALEQAAYSQDICFKYHAACYLTHSSIEATNNLCASNAFDPHDIDSIEIRVNPGHFDVCNIAEPRTGLEAKFSLRFTAAMALAGVDTSSIEIFTDELTRDPGLVTFRDKVRVVAHEQSNPDSIVTISTRSGEQFSDAVNVAIPMRDLDAQWTKLERKFHAVADRVVGRSRADELAGCIKTLEQLDHLEEFFDLLRVAA